MLGLPGFRVLADADADAEVEGELQMQVETTVHAVW
jgi:hypothetical protein